MSAPVSTNKIEDFVSSVRRLVSIDFHDQPAEADQGQDRLVLTPAQRVASDRATRAAPLVLTTGGEDEKGPKASAEAPAAEALAAEALAAEALAAEALAAEAVHVVEAEWEEEIWAEPEAPLAELALGAEVAELVPEPDPVVPEPVVSEPAVREAAAPEPEPVPAAAAQESKAPRAEVGANWLDEDLELLAPGQAPPAVEQPDETKTKRPDVLKLSAEQMLTDGEGNPLTLLDEAALQQIIRQLIRDELKGVLGERITHSVRKLVRAEINRALAAYALD